MIVDRHNESFQNNFLAGKSIYAASLVHHPSDGRHPCSFPFHVKSVKDERLHEIRITRGRYVKNKIYSCKITNKAPKESAHSYRGSLGLAIPNRTSCSILIFFVFSSLDLIL